MHSRTEKNKAPTFQCLMNSYLKLPAQQKLVSSLREEISMWHLKLTLPNASVVYTCAQEIVMLIGAGR